ncbi:MAG TPA: quinohemoprotein amine dehydrogenase subunit beta, partial [Candidatus Glassbacteria bacterium]|nr:quinohemoprotein amine dehydrogenase subunit beta [Candidatus Glassbacteria bacterium]
IWPIGTVANEFIRLYTVARYRDETQNLETADWLWGYERIDLTSGAAESREFAPLEAVYFSGMHRPGHPDQIYMTFNQLKRFDVTTMRETGSVDLDHSYYQVNFSPDGSTVYLSGALHDIAVFDAETLQKVTNIQLPGGDMALSTTAVFKR